MELRQMRYILTIAQEGTISRAAARLYISQPSLSQLLATVEKNIGGPLFDRSLTPLRPTELGELYLTTARQILALDKSFTDASADLLNSERGHIVIGSSPFRSTYLLAGFLPAFSARHPQLTLELRESTTHCLEELALAGEVDFTISLLPIDAKKFAYAQIFHETMLLVLPSAHPLARELNLTPGDLTHLQEIDLAELASTPFIRMHREQKLAAQLDGLCAAAGFTPRIALETRSMETALALAGAGLGATILPEFLLQSFRPAQLPCYAELTAHPEREVVIAWRKNKYLSRAARTFIAELKEFCH